MTKKISTIVAVLLFSSGSLFSQVKIGSNPGTINANSLLELESTTKGLLPPRVTLTDVSSYSPLSATIVEGMLVYNNGGTLSKGFYVWSGSVWKKLESTESSPVTKTASATLTKNETFVLVNSSTNAATITLPDVSSVDNGLSITIKNIGGADDLVTIANGDDPIDGGATVTLTRWSSQTFVAGNGGWIQKDKSNKDMHLLEVNANSSWTTIPEVLSFLNAHMDGATVIRLGGEVYTLSETQVIDLPYALTFQGLSYGTASIVPHATNLSGLPMFRCKSDCYFKMLNFSFNQVATYGDDAGEDAIHFVGSTYTYNEIKDCTFDGFFNTIVDSSEAELWVFETDISDASGNGILIHSDDPYTTVKVAETDFINCRRGINMDKGDSATIQLASGGYYNQNSTDTAIIYKPSTFTNFESITITGNSWNNSGVYISGFDFTRSDGRDADAILESNAGMGDQKPNCFINKLNGSTAVTLTNQSSWYDASWGTNTSSETCKWTISNNRITYQPNNRRNGLFTITGNLSVNSSSQNISIGIVKNGNSATRYGETTLRVVTSSQPFQFSFIAYLENIGPGDYFEIYYSNASSSGKQITIQDLQWFVNTQ